MNGPMKSLHTDRQDHHLTTDSSMLIEPPNKKTKIKKILVMYNNLDIQGFKIPSYNCKFSSIVSFPDIT